MWDKFKKLTVVMLIAAFISGTVPESILFLFILFLYTTSPEFASITTYADACTRQMPQSWI